MSEMAIDIGPGGNGPPSPRANPDLIGHEAQERLLLETLLDSGRMAHAWLINGPRGIGKATLAYRFARYLLASGAAVGKGPELFGPMNDEAGSPWEGIQCEAAAHMVIGLTSIMYDGAKVRETSLIRLDDLKSVDAFYGPLSDNEMFRETRVAADVYIVFDDTQIQLGTRFAQGNVTVNRDTVKVTENGGGLNVFAEMPTVQEVARVTGFPGLNCQADRQPPKTSTGKIQKLVLCERARER